jgi:hypothetical protein
MGKRAASLADLRRAARLAAETGLAVTVEAPDGTVYRIAPDAAPSPIGATEKEAAQCDKLFGL